MRKASQNKTKPTKQTVAGYIKTLTAAEQQQAKALLKVFKDATHMKPVLWGSMVGFGSYHYVYESGREGDYFATGFAIRKSGPTVYILAGVERYDHLLKKVGPHKVGKSCLYFKNLDEVDLKVLAEIVETGLRDLKKIYVVKG